MKTILKIFTFIILLLIVNNNKSYSSYDFKIDSSKKSAQIEFQKLYNETIEFIKKHEGLNNGEIYNCPAGYSTIGYGHVIKAGEVFENAISEKEAEELLKKDFDTAVELVENETKLNGSKLLAIAHFVYAKGIGNFNKSNLKKKILKNQPIKEEILKWCKYRKNGKLVISEYSYNIRMWELEMYNRH